MPPDEPPRISLHVLDTRRQVGRLLGRLDVSSPRRVLQFVICLLLAVGAYFLGRGSSMEEPAARGLFILSFATGLWITEAAPAFAVGILVIGLDVMLLALPGRPLGDEDAWRASIAVLGHPLVWLFFGGFVLAAGTERTQLDRVLARFALVRFGTRPASLLAGVMCVTFGFSAFMSNTATTALMLALLAPVLLLLKDDEPFKKALLLGTAVAANLGGMATLIGTPPNAIAAGLLAEHPDQRVGFLEWVALALPFSVVLCVAAWLLILRLYPSRLEGLDLSTALEPEERAIGENPRWQRMVVAVTGLATVGMWMTSGAHGLPTAVVSLLPVVVFTTLSVLGPTDIRGLPWDVLFLLAGGLVLGDVVKHTGLANWLVAGLAIDALGATGIALILAYASVTLANFMSHTAASNILLPIGVSLASGVEARVALPVAFAASAAMCLPIATPPNALVFATGHIVTRDLARVGIVLAVVTPVLAVLWIAVWR